MINTENNLTELNFSELQDINGGGILLAGAVIVGGAIVVFGGAFAVGYGLAKWLG